MMMMTINENQHHSRLRYSNCELAFLSSEFDHARRYSNKLKLMHMWN